MTSLYCKLTNPVPRNAVVITILTRVEIQHYAHTYSQSLHMQSWQWFTTQFVLYGETKYNFLDFQRRQIHSTK